MVRGGARGRGRDAAVALMRASGQPQAVASQSALLFKIAPGKKTVVVGVDAIVALMGIVYCGQDGYLARRDSCFYWMYILRIAYCVFLMYLLIHSRKVSSRPAALYIKNTQRCTLSTKNVQYVPLPLTMCILRISNVLADTFVYCRGNDVESWQCT